MISLLYLFSEVFASHTEEDHQHRVSYRCANKDASQSGFDVISVPHKNVLHFKQVLFQRVGGFRVS